MDLLNMVMSQGNVDHSSELSEGLRQLRYDLQRINQVVSQHEEQCNGILSDTVGCVQQAPKRMDSDIKQARYMYTMVKVIRGEQKLKAKVKDLAEKLDEMAGKAREIHASIALGSVLSKST